MQTQFNLATVSFSCKEKTMATKWHGNGILTLMFEQRLSYQNNPQNSNCVIKAETTIPALLALEILLQNNTTTMIKFPCRICQKAVGKKHKAILFDLCDKWIHIACNNLDKKTQKVPVFRDHLVLLALFKKRTSLRVYFQSIL